MRMQKWRAKVLTGVMFGICSSVAAVANGAPGEQVGQHVLRNSAGLTADEIRHNYDGCNGTTQSMKICRAITTNIYYS